MAKKKLVIVNGTSLSGKTTICKKLLESSTNSAWLDGDWCWMMNPFLVSEENKRMVDKNISFLLRSYLTNSNISVVYLSWVLHEEQIFANILNPMKDLAFDEIRFTLMASPETIRTRSVSRKGCSPEWIQDAIDRQVYYDKICSTKINVDQKRPEQISDFILTKLKTT